MNNDKQSPSITNTWDTIPYYNETALPVPVDPTAGTWPLELFHRKGNCGIYDPTGKKLDFNIKNPELIDYTKELDTVVTMQAFLLNGGNDKYVAMAKFWGNGVPVNQWTPIALQLISTYKVSPTRASRILCCLQTVIYDAFVITWSYKFKYNCLRPCQMNHDLKTVLGTPRFPSYVSGHSVISGACAVLLSYFFPRESEKLHLLAADASISRLYGGIHFESDLVEGLSLGKRIGAASVSVFQSDRDKLGDTMDHIYTTFMDAPILPAYYKLT